MVRPNKMRMLAPGSVFVLFVALVRCLAVEAETTTASGALNKLFRKSSKTVSHAETEDKDPLQKVILLLRQFKEKAQQEKHAEEVLFAQFSQFVQHEIGRIEQNIEKTNSTAIASKAQAEALRNEAIELEHRITMELTPELNADVDELTAGNAVDEQAKSIHLMENKDYRDGIAALDKAAAHLRASLHVDEKMRKEVLLQAMALQKKLGMKKQGISDFLCFFSESGLRVRLS